MTAPIEHQPELDEERTPDEAIDREECLDDGWDPADLNDGGDWEWEP